MVMEGKDGRRLFCPSCHQFLSFHSLELLPFAAGALKIKEA
jgi:hypothetical protein